MPWIVPFIPLIAAGTTAGTQIGLDLSGAGQPSVPSLQQQQMANSEQQQKQEQTQIQAADKAAFGNAQQQSLGSLSSDSLAELIANSTGSPGDIGLAQQTIFGNSPGLSTGG